MQTPQYPQNTAPSAAVELLATDPGNTSGGTQPLGTTQYVTVGTLDGRYDRAGAAAPVAALAPAGGVGGVRLARRTSTRRKARYGARPAASPPALTVTKTALTGASFYPAATSGVVTASPPWRWEGIAPYAPYTTSAFVTPRFAGAAQPVPFRVSFDFYGSQFAVQLFGTDYEFLVWVDDQPATAAPVVMPNDSATYWAVVTLPALAQYRVSVEISAGPSSTAYFGGVAALPTYDVRPPADPSGLRVAVIGDSYGCGKGGGNVSASPNPYSVDGYAPLLSQLLGVPDLWDFSIGGTGYVNAGSATAYSGRAADVVAAAPDVVIVQGSINDATQAGVQAAAQSLLSGLMADLPQAAFIMTGPLYAAAYYSSLTPLAAAIQAAAAALGVPFVDASGWATGTGHAGAPNGTGTSDFYLNSDNAHPTPAGHQMLADRLATAIGPLIGIDAGAEPATTPGLTPVDVTPPAGYALANGTGTILSWTAPADGQPHRFTAYTAMSVTAAETGGLVTIAFTLPDGTAATHTLFNAGAGTGDNGQANAFTRLVQAGTAVTIAQASALTAGAATVWAELWGS